MEEEDVVFRITVEQGNKSARLECDSVVTDKLNTIIKMYGGRQCNVWEIPVANQLMLQQEILREIKNCRFDVQNGLVQQNAPILKCVIKNKAPENDVFTFGLESSMDDYVWISTKLNKHYHYDDQIYMNHKSVQQTEILPEKRYVPLSFYKSCMAQLQIRHPNDTFEETKSLQKLMQEYTTINIPDPESISCYSIKSTHYNILLPHQKACITKGVKLNGQILIADEAGLGKTFSSLALANVFSHAFPLLIVCPKWMRNHWEDQIKKWLQISSIDVVSDSSQVLKNCKVTIISYLQSKLIDVFNYLTKKLKKNYKICIVDESQNLKNGSEVAKKCQNIFDQCEYKIFLSGAPIMSRPSELITQLTFICKQKINGFMVFTENEQNDVSDMLDPINSKSCNEYLQKYYLARTSKKKCLEILPDFNRFVVQIPIDESFKKQIYKNSSEAYKQLGRAKLIGMRTILQELLIEGEKVLFFAFHKQVIQAVEQLCQDLYMKYITIDGTKVESERNEAIKNFQDDSQIRIAIVSFKTGSTGISLTAATSIVFGEMYFSDQSMMMQAEGRAYRIGQKQILDCYYLIGDCKQDQEMFNEIKKNYFEFSEFLNGFEEDFEAIELTLEEFSKMKRHLPKQKQPKQKIEKLPEPQKMMTRSAFRKQLNQAFEQIKNRTYLTQPIPIKKTIKKKKEEGKKKKEAGWKKKQTQ